LRRNVWILIILCVVLAGVGTSGMIYRWADKVFRNQMAANYQFKRAHVSVGKVLSVSMVQPKQGVTNSSDDQPKYKICFKIDSFADVPPELRSEYEAAERSRERAEGPPCVIARQTQLPTKIRSGQAVQVVYLLYGKGVITVERLVVDGQELELE